MIDKETQSYLDKKFARLEALVTKVLEGQKPPTILYPKTRPGTEEEATTKPAEWSNHVEYEPMVWAKMGPDKLRNRLGIQWPTYLLVQDGVVKDELRMAEIREDNPDLYAELMAGVSSDYAAHSPNHSSSRVPDTQPLPPSP